VERRSQRIAERCARDRSIKRVGRAYFTRARARSRDWSASEGSSSSGAMAREPLTPKPWRPRRESSRRRKDSQLREFGQLRLEDGEATLPLGTRHASRPSSLNVRRPPARRRIPQRARCGTDDGRKRGRGRVSAHRRAGAPIPASLRAPRKARGRGGEPAAPPPRPRPSTADGTLS